MKLTETVKNSVTGYFVIQISVMCRVIGLKSIIVNTGWPSAFVTASAPNMTPIRAFQQLQTFHLFYYIKRLHYTTPHLLYSSTQIILWPSIAIISNTSLFIPAIINTQNLSLTTPFPFLARSHFITQGRTTCSKIISVMCFSCYSTPLR